MPVDDIENNDFEYVGFWVRFGASLIDTLLVMAVLTPLLMAIYGRAYFDNAAQGIASGSLDTLINWVLPAAAVIVFWLTKQATPGKMVFGAKVVDARTGGPLSVGQSIGRYLGYYVAMLPFFLGFFWIGFDARKQGWHDKLAGTVVIRPKQRGTEPVRFNSKV
ncbi:RDD family protein [soil metagenome]